MDIIEQAIAIPVSGGRVLSARLWRPKDGRHPAVLDASPYRVNDLFAPLMESQLPVLASRGYAAIAIDISGSGNSTGLLLDEYAPQEIDDLAEAIAFAAGQTWCDGQVALSGLSWAAFAALRAAARRPPALKAMALGGVSEDGWRTDIHYLGGALYTGHIDWAGVMLMFNALPPDPVRFAGGDWRAAWEERLKANVPWLIQWLSHQNHDAYWTDRAAPTDGDVPLLLYSGLADKYATSVLRLAEAWRGPVRTIIGPWEHAPPDIAARGPRIGFLNEAVRWFDEHLKGLDCDAMNEAPLRLWLASPDSKGQLTDGAWIASDWPTKPGLQLDLSVRGGTLVPGAGADHGSVDLAAGEAMKVVRLSQDLYEDAPAPFDLAAAASAGASIARSEPFDADVLIGPAPVLRCAVESARGHVIARLLDIAPDGSAIRMTTAACNLALLDGRAEVAISFQATAWRLKKGHSLALVLSGTGWPTIWPARTTQSPRVSRVRLGIPLAAARGEEPGFAPPQSAPTSGVEAMKWITADGQRLPPAEPDAISLSSNSAAHHLIANGTDYYIASRFDLIPLAGGQVRATKVYRVAIERPGWSIRVNTRLTVTSTEDAFEIAWTIEAQDNEIPVHRTDRRMDVPRTTI